MRRLASGDRMRHRDAGAVTSRRDFAVTSPDSRPCRSKVRPSAVVPGARCGWPIHVALGPPDTSIADPALETAIADPRRTESMNRQRRGARRLLPARAAGILAIGLLTGGSPVLAAGPAPIGLGSAATFAVLAGSPAVTNSGSTVIGGDLGIHPAAAVKGFPPGTLNGTIHAGDATAQEAKVDLVAAYDDAAGRTPAVAVAGGVLGGLTLGAGVYTGGGVTLDLTGRLKLDAQNHPNAVWIFQATSDLVTAASSSVTFINGGAGRQLGNTRRGFAVRGEHPCPDLDHGAQPGGPQRSGAGPERDRDPDERRDRVSNMKVRRPGPPPGHTGRDSGFGTGGGSDDRDHPAPHRRASLDLRFGIRAHAHAAVGRHPGHRDRRRCRSRSKVVRDGPQCIGPGG